MKSMMKPVAPEILRGKHLVVFGAGYLGGALVEQAVAAGLRVTALTRNAEKARMLAERGAVPLIADLADGAWENALPEGADLVVNCVSSGGGGLEGYRHSYVDGMRAVLAWAERSPVGPLVYTSSTSVYPQDGGVTVDEEAPLGEAVGAPAILREAEDLVKRWPKRWCILRLAGLYGPGRHHLLDQARAGEPVWAGRGDHRLNLIHRDDAVAAIWAALVAPEDVASQVFNVADDGAVPKAELAAWLAERLGKPVPHFSGEVTRGRRGIAPDRIVSNARIKERLGWQPKYATFRDGYAELLEA